MFQYLEKIDPEKRQMRYYSLSLSKTLFGEWCLVREWGRIGSKGGRQMCHYGHSRADVQAQLEAVAARKQRRGYVCSIGAGISPPSVSHSLLPEGLSGSQKLTTGNYVHFIAQSAPIQTSLFGSLS